MVSSAMDQNLAAWTAFQTRLHQLDEEMGRLKRAEQTADILSVVAAASARLQQLNGPYEQKQEELDRAVVVCTLRQEAIDQQFQQGILEARIKRRQAFLEALRQANLPGSLLTEAEKEVWLLTAPLPAVQQHLQELKGQLHNLNHARGRELGQIRGATRSIRVEKAAVEISKRDLRQQMAEWAMTDRAHLEFFLVHSNCRHQLTLEVFHQKHPRVDIADLDAKYGTSPPLPIPEDERTPSGWQLVFLRNRQDQHPIPLPSNRQHAETSLESLLEDTCPSVDAKKVLTYLERVTAWPPHARHRLKKLENEFPLGWRILRLGSTHRALLNIKEEEKIIEFTVAHRGRAYRDSRWPGRKRK